MFLHLTFIQDLRKLMLFRSLLQFVIDVSSPFWHVLFNNFCMLPLLYNTCSSCIITSQVPSAQYFQWCIKSLLHNIFNDVSSPFCHVIQVSSTIQSHKLFAWFYYNFPLAYVSTYPQVFDFLEDYFCKIKLK